MGDTMMNEEYYRALATVRGVEIAKLQTRIYRQRLANKKARGLNASIPLHKKQSDEARRQMAIYKDQNEKLLKTVESLRGEILELRASRAEDLAGQDN